MNSFKFRIIILSHSCFLRMENYDANFWMKGLRLVGELCAHIENQLTIGSLGHGLQKNLGLVPLYLKAN
jgi:hypothetical protein